MLTSLWISTATALLAQPGAGTGAPPPPATGGAGSTAAQVFTERSLWGYIQSGGFISYVMVLLSMVALGLIIANLIQLRRDAMAKPGLVALLERLFKERNIDLALQACAQKEHDCFLARVIKEGVGKAARSPFGMLELKPALEEAGSRELENLDRVNHGIAIMAGVGPMLGLLGTVIGMIGAFATIGALEGAARSQQLASYMSIALVATAEGLIIGVPCTIAFALFKKRTDRLVMYCGQLAEQLVLPLQTGGAARPAPGAPAPRAQTSAPVRPAQVTSGAPGGGGGA